MHAPETHRFSESGSFPNSPHPVLVYRQVHATTGGEEHIDLARFFERLFAENGWPAAWRNGICTRHHYHSTAHEALGVYSGSVRARLGGPEGRVLELRAGDVVVIPAGVAHCNEGQSSDFKVVGAYPDGSNFDMNYGRSGERPGADRRIALVPLSGARAEWSVAAALAPGFLTCRLGSAALARCGTHSSLCDRNERKRCHANSGNFVNARNEPGSRRV